jgi:hypothetical protein
MAPSPANRYADVLRHDLCAFIHRSFLELNAQTQFLSNWHIEVLAAKLEEVRRGSCKRLIVNVPPRHLKSHATSIAFPAWVLGHDPSKHILSVTYAQDFSDLLARKSRTLMTSPFYKGLFDTRLSKGREAVSDFETTDGGTRFSTSVGGVLTGRGADIIIIDDALKADDAQSEPRRRSVNEWFDNTLRSRLNSQEKGVIIIVMQRLHADDEAVEILMRHNPRAKVIWAHTGFGLASDRVSAMLAKYPKLWGELSYRGGIVDGGGRLTPEWRGLFERYPDRFLLGSDTWIHERWYGYDTIMKNYRAWLVQLPPEQARRIAHGNAERLFGGKVE